MPRQRIDLVEGTSMIECRRSLHTNYNCADIDRLEHWYTTVFEMQTVMRSGGTAVPGDAFGIYQDTTSDVAFLYDHLGGRRTTAVELVRWIVPATTGNPYPTPWHCGIQSFGFAVPQIDSVASAAREAGGRVEQQVGGSALLLRDPEGVAVEVVAGSSKAELRQIRIVCSDIGRSAAWYERIGMRPAPNGATVRGEHVWADVKERAIVDERAYVTTDDDRFAFVLTEWSGSAPDGATYGMPYHHGLYRMAIAVDDVDAAYDEACAAGLVNQPPHVFAMPGTPITDGLKIQYLRDPDGLLVELVERPRSYFADDLRQAGSTS